MRTDINQDEKEAQRKLEQKREIERRRQAQQEETRRQEQQSQRQELEKQREKERAAAADDAKRLAQKQAIEKRRLEMQKREQRPGSRAENVGDRQFHARTGMLMIPRIRQTTMLGQPVDLNWVAIALLPARLINPSISGPPHNTLRIPQRLQSSQFSTLTTTQQLHDRPNHKVAKTISKTKTRGDSRTRRT